jgi:arylsulfatase A-like enzyme
MVNGVPLAASLAMCDGTTNSLPIAKIGDYTNCEPTVMAYDDTKVQAVINWIDGKLSDGSGAAPVPTIFGMNFQEVSPSALLAGALAHVDQALGKMVAELTAKGLLDSTLIIVSAKHGQSPIDRSALHMESGGHGTADVVDPIGAINSVDPNVDAVLSTFVNPNSMNQYAANGHLQTDDVGLVWLQNQATSNVTGVVTALQAAATMIEANALPPGTIFSANITSGSALAAIYGDPTSTDPVASARAPNVVIQPNHGVIYSGSAKKIAEHGGGTTDDTGVALLVSLPGLKSASVSTSVATTQVAPTILKALGLDPMKLQGVVKEGTAVLPSLF